MGSVLLRCLFWINAQLSVIRELQRKRDYICMTSSERYAVPHQLLRVCWAQLIVIMEKCLCLHSGSTGLVIERHLFDIDYDFTLVSLLPTTTSNLHCILIRVVLKLLYATKRVQYLVLFALLKAVLRKNTFFFVPNKEHSSSEIY